MGALAACYEQKGDYVTAAEQYGKAVKKAQDFPRAAEFSYRAARCYELADDVTKALELYEKIINDHEDSNEKDQAVMQKAKLNAEMI